MYNENVDELNINNRRKQVSKTKFKTGDTAWYNGIKVKVTSIRRELSEGTPNGNLYYRIRKVRDSKSFASVRSDRLDRI